MQNNRKRLYALLALIIEVMLLLAVKSDAHAEGSLTCKAIGLEQADINAVIQKKQVHQLEEKLAIKKQLITDKLYELQGKHDPCQDVVKVMLYELKGDELVRQHQLKKAVKDYRHGLVKVKYFNKTISLQTQADFGVNLSFKMGEIYYLLGQLKSAQLYYENVDRIAGNPAIPPVLAQYGASSYGAMKTKTLINLATIYEKTKQREKAQHIYKELLDSPYCQILDCADFKQKYKQ